MWPTPQAFDANDIQRSAEALARAKEAGGCANLREAVMWPTPRVEGFDAGKHRGKADSLHAAVKMLPTPRAIYGEHPGMTNLSHLTGRALTSSPEASPASRSAWPGSAKAREMTAISGRNLRDLWERSDPVGVCLRMCRESSIWRVGSPRYTLTWKRKATPWGASFYQLRLSERRTAGIGSGLWPTTATTQRPNEGNVRLLRSKVERGELSEDEATAMLGKSPYEAQGKIPAEMWPTPDVPNGVRKPKHGMSRAGMTPDGTKRQVGLANAVAMLPTPTATAEHVSDMLNQQLSGKQRATLKAAGTPFSSATGGMKLSAAWVSRLMGYPDGWLDVD